MLTVNERLRVRDEYRRGRWKFLICTYSAAFVIYAIMALVLDDNLTGWKLLVFCGVLVFIEQFLWINIGLPGAVRRGSNQFKRAYYEKQW